LGFFDVFVLEIGGDSRTEAGKPTAIVLQFVKPSITVKIVYPPVGVILQEDFHNGLGVISDRLVANVAIGDDDKFFALVAQFKVCSMSCVGFHTFSGLVFLKVTIFKALMHRICGIMAKGAGQASNGFNPIRPFIGVQPFKLGNVLGDFRRRAVPVPSLKMSLVGANNWQG
jgi:hypothetical protein